MVIVGYQGIGKSTLAKNANGFIDLESSNFFVNSVRSPDWYIPYCKIALNLSTQGYDVFVSSHQVVRDYLADEHNHDLLIICPSKDLKNQWIKKLEDRYNATGLDKDYKAWKNAECRYEENIDELLNQEGFGNFIVIGRMDYDLKDQINSYKEAFGNGNQV